MLIHLHVRLPVQDGSGTLTADEVAEAIGCTGRMSGAVA